MNVSQPAIAAHDWQPSWDPAGSVAMHDRAIIVPMELIDSHAHIDFPQFDQDRSEMLERARAVGITTLLAIGTGPGLGRLDAAIPFAEKYDWIYATVGIHPHEAQTVTQEHFDDLARLAQHPRVIAWGEIGLDYHYDFSPRDVQQRVFGEQLKLAARARLPIIIHCREAWPDCLAMLEQTWRGTGLGGIFHCFSGTLEEARKGIEMGFMVSFAGNSTYPKAQNLRDTVRDLPQDKLLIETDAPYLAPQPFRGKRNEPAFVAEVARTLSGVRNLAPDEFAAVTASNFRRFFDLKQEGTGGNKAHFR
jgi:TatD DNase family protein